MGRKLYLSTDPGSVGEPTPTDATILAQAAVSLRRAALAVLCDEGALSLETLSERIVERGEASEHVGASEDARERVATRLYHNHLQYLSSAGLVVHDAETGVALHSNVDENRAREVLETGTGEWDALGAILSDDRRKRVVDVLDAEGGPMDVEELVHAVVAFEGADVDGPAGAVASTHVSLHHVHLPKLEDVGVLEWDRDAGRVEVVDVPDAYTETTDAPTVPSL